MNSHVLQKTWLYFDILLNNEVVKSSLSCKGCRSRLLCIICLFGHGKVEPGCRNLWVFPLGQMFLQFQIEGDFYKLYLAMSEPLLTNELRNSYPTASHIYGTKSCTVQVPHFSNDRRNHESGLSSCDGSFVWQDERGFSHVAWWKELGRSGCLRGC